jgi:methoxymalonate biosynthesis acyl carrier protein
MNAVADKVRGFLARYPRGAEIPSDQNIFASGVLTSLLALQMVLFLEREFKIVIENEDLEFSNFATIDAISSFVARKTA